MSQLKLDNIKLNSTSTGLVINSNVTATKFFGDGSELTGISILPFPFTGSANISGSLNVTSAVTASVLTGLTVVDDTFSRLITLNGGYKVIGQSSNYYKYFSNLPYSAGKSQISVFGGIGANGSILSGKVQSDGKIIIGGSFTSYSGSTSNYIARINTDGTLDTSFNVGTGASTAVRTTTLQPDGKIIIGGDFTSYSGSSIKRIARINTDGTLDTSFNVGTGTNSTINITTLQPDGKIIIGGGFNSYSGSSINSLARINTDGTLDTTFNVGTGANGVVYSTAVQPDGKIIIGGGFTSYSGSSINSLARINTDGTLDTTFNVGTGTNGIVYSTAVQPDSKIIIGGFFNSYSGSSINRIARLNTDGTLDTTFNVGTGASSTVYAITLQPDGKIVIGGVFTSYSGSTRNYIARINTDGTLDTSFNLQFNFTSYEILNVNNDNLLILGVFEYANRLQEVGRLAYTNQMGELINMSPTNDYIENFSNSIISTPFSKFNINPSAPGKLLKYDTERVVALGDFTAYSNVSRNRIVRFNVNGTLDSTFNVGSGTNARIRTGTFQPDSKLIIAGEFTSYSGSSINRIARINTDGTLDTSFNVGTGTNGTILATTLQPDGKIIIGGVFTSYSGSTSNNIVRINTDGTLDTSFNVNNAVYTIDVQLNGNILIGGAFSFIGGINLIGLTSIDLTTSIPVPTFNVGTGSNLEVYTTTLQPDSKLIIGGAFTSYSGSSINRLARINTNGTLDTSFNVGTGANGIVRTTTLQPDGKIIIGGDFTSYSGSTRNYIARLNTDGTLDTSLNVGTGAENGTISAIIPQPDGKLLVGGGYNRYSGSTQYGLVRINSDGTKDSTFSIGLGLNDNIYRSVNSIILQPDGKIVVGGTFTGVNGSNTPGVVRLNSNGTVDTSFNVGTGIRETVFGNVSGISSVSVSSLALQNDGKILAGTNFGFNIQYSGSLVGQIFRINTDGTLDTSFVNEPTLGMVIERVNKIHVLEDGKILVGGTLNYYNGAVVENSILLNSDGSLSASFSPGLSNSVRDFAVTGSTVFYGGSFSSVNSNRATRIGRLNNDGTFDTTFNSGIGANDLVTNISMLDNEEIAIRGGFSNYSGSNARGLVILNSNGTVKTITESTSASSTGFIKILENGKIITNTNLGIIQLNSDGSRDFSFKRVQILDNGSITDVVELNDSNKFLVSGPFTGGITEVSYTGDLIGTGSIYLNPVKNHIIDIKGTSMTKDTLEPIRFSSTIVIHTGSLSSQTTTKSGAYTDYTASYSVINGTPFLELTNVKPFDTINYEMDIVEMG